MNSAPVAYAWRYHHAPPTEAWAKPSAVSRAVKPHRTPAALPAGHAAIGSSANPPCGQSSGLSSSPPHDQDWIQYPTVVSTPKRLPAVATAPSGSSPIARHTVCASASPNWFAHTGRHWPSWNTSTSPSRRPYETPPLGPPSRTRGHRTSSSCVLHCMDVPDPSVPDPMQSVTGVDSAHEDHS